MAQVVVEMTSDEHRLFAAQQKLIEQEANMARGYEKVGRKAKRAGRQARDGFGGRALSSVKSYAAGVVSVSAALGSAGRAYQVWLQNMREGSAEMQRAANQAIAFAALQEGGVKAERVQQASALARRYGIRDRGQAFNAVQALQSALGGDFAAGMKAAETVFRATQVGIPLREGLELELVGAAGKQPPGATLRRAFAAGQASARDPMALARAGRGLPFWDDQEIAMASAAVLAALFGEEVATYTRAAGIGLSTTSAEGFQKTFKKLGVADATRMERLQALREAGMDTPEKLAAAGLGEMRQQIAISTLVKNLDELDRILGEVREQARPGLFAAQREAVEAELPMMRLQREMDLLEAGIAESAAFGPRALEFGTAEREERIRAAAFRRLGFEQAGPFDIVEGGRATKMDELQFRLWQFMSGQVPGARGAPIGGILQLLAAREPAWERVQVEMDDIREGMRETSDNMRKAAESFDLGMKELNEATRRISGTEGLRERSEN
jgi:hypothetical protein